MKNIKRLAALSVVLLLVFAFTVNAAASRLPLTWDERFDVGGHYSINDEGIDENISTVMKITSKRISDRDEGLEMKGFVPVVEGLQSFSFQTRINAAITEIVDRKITLAKDAKSKSINFSYSNVSDGSVSSLIIYSAIASPIPKTEVSSVNFNIDENKMLAINDVLGVNGIYLANKVVSGQIKQQPDRYYPNFSGIDYTQAFYVENGALTLIFSEQQIAPISEGPIEFTIRLENIVSITITRNDYYSKLKYDIKMIPIRLVCEGLGYTPEWIPGDKPIVELYKNRRLVTSITVDENSYIRDKSSPRQLESAPDLKNDVVYAPISFFDQILDFTYSVEDNGDIVFSMYRD